MCLVGLCIVKDFYCSPVGTHKIIVTSQITKANSRWAEDAFIVILNAAVHRSWTKTF